MNKHIMIDIETLGKGDRSVIASVGAVAFDKHNNNLREIYQEYCIQSQLNMGRTVDASTLQWWQEQETSLPLNGCELESNLMDLHAFIDDHKPPQEANTDDCDQEDVLYVWAHGVTFDIVKLQSLFSEAYNYVPWEHWQIMDLRTLVQLWPTPKEDRKKNNHNALDDAKNQVEWILKINEKLDFL